MTFHAYFRYVCLFLTCLYMAFSAHMHAQEYRQRSDTTRTLLIIDGENGNPIEGAGVLAGGQVLVSLSEGTVTIPSRNSADTVLVQSLGYKSQYISLKDVFKRKNTYTIRLSPEMTTLGEVIIIGERSGITRNAVSGQIPSPAINHALGTSLGALLEQVSGVSSISTGTAIAKPVIQGMYGNRILIINNGTRQTGQQWGADHAPEVDMNGSNSIQVVKGSDAVRYGSEALGGIIIMEQAALPFRTKSLKGKGSMLYGSNGRRFVLTGQMEGTFPFLRDIAWRVQGTCSNSGDRSTANYLLNNTGTRELHTSASLGYDHGRLRIEGFYSRFYNRMGVMLSAQMGSEDLLAERIRLGRPLHTDPFARSITYPYQEVTHQTAVGKIRFSMWDVGNLYWQGSWQKDDRQEKRIRRLGSDIPAVSLHLYSFQNSLRWKWNYNSWQTEIGGQIMFIDNHSRAQGQVLFLLFPITRRHRQEYMALESIITAREELKRVFALTGRKPVPAAMTGLEIPMGEQESSITYHTVWEPITFFPDTGNLPPISGWPGGPPTCMSCTAMGMNSDQECLSEGIRS